ncbi:MAG: methyltransferase [Rhodospirillaceae bacterium]|nr:methyltransferase [Rhodospirillaceae bacterium]
MSDKDASCVFCGGTNVLVKKFDARPNGETDFGIDPYRRSLWQCAWCAHVVNRFSTGQEATLYDGAYASATYGDEMREAFHKIMSLPVEQSDNRQRIARINAFADLMGWDGERTCLDIGSGIGVFPAAMREASWSCTALDPDPKATSMIGELAEVSTVTGDFMTVDPPGTYRLVSLNKVLEHVREPVAMLARTIDFLSPGGAVYVELPDGEGALADAGPDREEFFIEHFDAYSAASVALLIRAAGFYILSVERVREASGKYTLRAFATPGWKRQWPR